MKDYVEIPHVTKSDAFRMNRDQVMDLEISLKIHTNVSNFETASPKIILTLIFFLFPWYSFKMGKHSDFQIAGIWRDFLVVTKLMKNFKSFYILNK